METEQLQDELELDFMFKPEGGSWVPAIPNDDIRYIIMRDVENGEFDNSYEFEGAGGLWAVAR